MSQAPPAESVDTGGQAPYEPFPSDDCVELSATILQALSYPLRMRIVLHLLEREATGGELAQKLRVNQTVLAHHLRHLRVAGLIQRRRIGNHVRYGAAPPVADVVRAAITCATDQQHRGSRAQAWN
jgi:ArsR family transcriptional regulator